jgi:hypothetical protein
MPFVVGDTTLVVMTKPLGVCPDGLNHVAFHAQHLTAVAKQFGIGLPNASMPKAIVVARLRRMVSIAGLKLHANCQSQASMVGPLCI